MDRFCKPIMMKPRPAPAKPATPEAPPTPPPRPVSSINVKELMLMPALPRGQQMAVLRHRLLQNQWIRRLLQLLHIVLSSGSCLLMFCFSRKNLVLMYKYFYDSKSREKLGDRPIMKASGVCPPLSGL